MAEPNVAESKQTETKPAIASMGAVKMASFIPPVNGNVDEKVADKIENKEGVTNPANTNGSTEKKPEINDDAIKEWFKSKNIEYEGEEILKAKLNYKPPVEPTEEEKLAQQKIKNKRLLDKWIEGGGTEDTYVAVKNAANADLPQLSLNALKKELKDAKFTEGEIQEWIATRYFTDKNIDELEQGGDETDEEFEVKKEKLKKFKEYGANKLANRSSYTKKQAQEFLAGLNKAIESEDLDAQEELTISANIDEKFKTVQLKDTYEIGEINGKPILPVESEVPESEIAEVHNMLKDPIKRNNLLLNKDGSFNYNQYADVLIENKKLKAAIKTAFHESATRTNAHWQKIFPNETAYAIGVGGGSTNTSTSKGKIASVGKTKIA